MEDLRTDIQSPLLDRLRDRLRLLELSGGDHEAEEALCRAKIRILESGGKAMIRRLVNRKGEDVGAVLIKTRYGLSWKFPDGSWVPDRPAALRRHGLKPALRHTTAWATLRDGQVEIYPTAVNYLERARE